MKLPYENKHYAVVLNEARNGYEVINKETKVIESEHPVLPRAIIVANEYNDYLNKIQRELVDASNVVALH